MLKSGASIGRYRILDRVGEGAMGEVFRAFDQGLERVVALKLLLPFTRDQERSRRRFEREARLAARINHPAVAHVYDIGEHEGSPFIAMEFVPGTQLRALLDFPLSESRALGIAKQVCEGLCAAHSQGVLHRDLKPENILIWGDDQVKLLDFGLAKSLYAEENQGPQLTVEGLTGTPRYMAPEQVREEDVDARTDIYTVGAILYELVAGRPAQPGKGLGEIIHSVLNREPSPLAIEDCSPEFAGVIEKALQKGPEDRYQTADALYAALCDLETDNTLITRAPTQLSLEQEHVPHPKAVAYADRARDVLTGVSTTSSMAKDLIQKAIELDPEFAPAHALYAEACAALFNTGQLTATALDEAQDALEKAERLDSSLPDIKVSRARILWTKTFNFPAETALRELRSALKEKPDHPGALRLWGTIAGHVGLFHHAEAAINRRLAVAPEDELMLHLRCGLYMAVGRASETINLIHPLVLMDRRCDEPVLWWSMPTPNSLKDS